MIPTALTSVTIRTATSWDIRPVAGVLTTAAVTATQGTSPDAVGRALLMYDDMVNLTRHAIRNGTALIAEHESEAIGALAWSNCPPRQADIGAADVQDPSDPPACLLHPLPGTLEQPHWDLRAFGVLPVHWRRRVGTALLDAWHQQPESVAIARAAVTIPCYGSLFADHGYQVVGVIRPGRGQGGPVMQRMWRPVPARATVRTRTRAARGRPAASLPAADDHL